MTGEIQSILLVDWPSRDIPLKLVQSGFTVFSYSPDGYHQAFVTVTGNSNDELVFHPMNKPPVAVDLVMIYRPSEEHASIIRDHVIPLGAKVLWLQPPVESMETGKMAIEQGLTFVQGRDIREIIR